jgi:hypothetical protein
MKLKSSCYVCFLSYITLLLTLLQEQHVKETEAPEIEFVVMPVNTAAKHINLKYGSVNVDYFRQEYEDAIGKILHVSVGSSSMSSTTGDSGHKEQNVSGGRTAQHARPVGGMQTTMLFCKKMKDMSNEFEDLLSVLHIFCTSDKTEQHLENYCMDVQSSQSTGKRKRPQYAKTDAIPIQLVTIYDGNPIVDICANSVSSILTCQQLLSNHLIQSENFLEFFNEQLTSGGAKHSSPALIGVATRQIELNKDKLLLQQQGLTGIAASQRNMKYQNVRGRDAAHMNVHHKPKTTIRTDGLLSQDNHVRPPDGSKKKMV